MKQIFTLAFFVLFLHSLMAQHEPLNPYETIGKKAEVLTLSKGKYQETFSNDTIMRIGSVMYHRFTGEVVVVVTDDTLHGEYSLQPEVMSRWLSIDPLAADFPEWSPYVYTLNNPIIFIDPDGKSPKPPDDYRLKQNGTVELIRKTDDATDKLFAYHLDGEPTGAYLEVNKGILQTYAENEKTGTGPEGSKFSSVEINDNETATKVFEFMAENTIVEFSHVKFDDKGNAISTSHMSGSEGGGGQIAYDKAVSGSQVKEKIHSHPTDGEPSPADKSNAGYWKSFPGQNVTLKIYKVMTKQYVEYDQNGEKK